MNDRRLTILLVVQGIALLVFGAILALVIVQHGESTAQTAKILQELRENRQARYEYKVMTVASEGHDRRGDAALSFASVTPGEPELTSLGSAGWEVVTSYLELETAYPNFGNSEYVTGLQPNIRPQRLVIVLRRRVA